MVTAIAFAGTLAGNVWCRPRSGRICAGAATSPLRPGHRRTWLFVDLGLDDLLPAVVPAGTYVVTQMHFAAHRLDRQGRLRQKVVRPMHASLGSRLLVLLDSHFRYSSRFNRYRFSASFSQCSTARTAM